MKEGQEENQNQEQPVQRQSNALDLLGGLVAPEILKDVLEIEERVLTKSPEKKETEKKEIPEKKTTIAKKETVAEEEVEEENENEEEANEPSEFLEDGKTKNPEYKKPVKKEKKEVEIPDNKFGVKIKKEEKQKLDIESFDEIPKVLKQKYGQDIKDVKGMTKFFETADKWRADSQVLDKVTKEKDNAIAVFENLPSDLLEDVKAHYRGEDYREAREKTPKLDFSKPAEKQDLKKLVNAYFPGDFKAEDFDSDEKSKELIIAEKAAIKQYNTDKFTREQRAKHEIEKAETRTKAFKSSVTSSVQALKNDFPDMTPDVINDINDTLSSGSLVGVFFNNDGTAKPNAAKALALALHGEDFIGQLMEVARNQGQSEANEEIVERANGKKKPGSNKAPEKVRKEVEETIERLIPHNVVGKRTF